MYNTIFLHHSELLKALAHPKRLEIVHLLRGQELSVSDIQAMLGLPQANLSQHLQLLREAGVVSTRKNGKKVMYSLAHPNFITASDLIREVLIERARTSQEQQELRLRMRQLVPLVHDPVCGMRLSPKTASYLHNYGGDEYYFCAEGCLSEFKQQPEVYVRQAK